MHSIIQTKQVTAITSVNKTTILRYLLLFLLGVIIWLAVTPKVPTTIESINDKLNHWFAFVVLAAVADNAYPKNPNWHTGLGLLVYAVLIEFIQYFLPWREASVLDVVADISGILSYILLFLAAQTFLLKRTH